MVLLFYYAHFTTTIHCSKMNIFCISIVIHKKSTLLTNSREQMANNVISFADYAAKIIQRIHNMQEIIRILFRNREKTT